MAKLVVLEGLEHHNRFYSTYTGGGEDPTITRDGKVSYKVLGYADTDEEARAILYDAVELRERALTAVTVEDRVAALDAYVSHMMDSSSRDMALYMAKSFGGIGPKSTRLYDSRRS